MFDAHSSLQPLNLRFLLLAAVLGLLIVTSQAAGAQTPAAQTGSFTVLHTFTGGADGGTPAAAPVFDAQGNLYGTTEQGGDYNYGTVFKLAPDGTETVLHAFAAVADGEGPLNPVTFDRQGNLYGATVVGGDYTNGTVFRIAPDGTYTILYSFAQGADIGYPEGNLVFDSNGNLYGTASFFGSQNCENGCGGIFQIAPSGVESTFYGFTGTPDGSHPVYGYLSFDQQGNLYGTTEEGGAYGYGTVFQLTPTGTETVIYSFSGGTDGATPYGGVIFDSQGNLYGATAAGGASNQGTIFKMTPSGTETVLYNFTGKADAGYPCGGLTWDSAGNLYGASGCAVGSKKGAVFELANTKKGYRLTILHSFKAKVDGSSPNPGLVWDAAGNLYGTAAIGGKYNNGTLFKLTLPPATTTTLSSSPNPSAYGEAVTFTAVVAANVGTPPDGETVSFMNGKTVLGTGTLSGGSASLTVSALKVGTASVTAVYGGDSNFPGSTSNVVNQVVGKATTSAILASSVNPSAVGQAVTFTATVTPEFGGTVTGKVAFYDGTTLLKRVAVSGGQAELTTSKLTAGEHNITATYGGSTDFTGSSAALTQTVN